MIKGNEKNEKDGELMKEKLRIFIAEDEPIVLTGFQMMLDEIGHEVVGTASDGASAVKGILKEKPDMMLMDINMPDMDGISAIEKVNESLEIPAVVITGYRSQNYVNRAVRAGVYGYLQKPVDAYQLESTIRVAYTQFQKALEAKEGRENAERLLKERKVIERAKGLLMDQFGLSEAQAMKALQKKSADTNKKIYVVANEILGRGEKLL